MDNKLAIKRNSIHAAIKRAEEGNYPIIEPTPEDRDRDLSWWIKAFDAKAFLFSENGSATWLFPNMELKAKPVVGRVVVAFEGTRVADSTSCLEFFETPLPGQIYIPRADVDFAHLARSETMTYCPFKNIATYYSVEVDGKTAKDAFWTYDEVYEKLPGNGNADGLLEIKGMLAADSSKLTVEVR